MNQTLLASKPNAIVFDVDGNLSILDVNTNVFIPLTNDEIEIFNQLPWGPAQNVQRITSSTRTFLRKLARLQKSGYLLPSPVKKVSWRLSNDRYERLVTGGLSKLILELTEECNLRCKYCLLTEERVAHPERERTARMNIETAAKAVRYFLHHSTNYYNADTVSISFYGGEPLLRFSLIEELISIAEHEFPHRRDIIWHITTNGTMLTPKVWDFFVKHNVHVCISVDCTPEMHDRNRVSSQNTPTFSRIEQNCAYCANTYSSYYLSCVSFNLGIPPPFEYRRIREYYNNHSDLWGRGNVLNPIAIDTRDMPGYRLTLEQRAEFRKTVSEWLTEYVTLASLPRPLTNPEEKSLHFLDAFVGRTFRRTARALNSKARLGRHFVRPPGCQPGIDKLLVLTNGDYHVCEKCSYGPETKVGGVDTGIDLALVRTAVTAFAVARPARCRTCWALRYCTICIAHMRVEKRTSAKAALDKQCTAMRNTLYANIRGYLQAIRSNAFVSHEAFALPRTACAGT